jgi:hypothetical protein
MSLRPTQNNLRSGGSSNSSLNDAGSEEMELTKKEGRDSTSRLRDSVDSLHLPDIHAHQ